VALQSDGNKAACPERAHRSVSMITGDLDMSSSKPEGNKIKYLSIYSVVQVSLFVR
jgi:hypothetical protein